jgi:peptidoglycan/LPS O-acetylase OafA/YrhL
VTLPPASGAHQPTPGARSPSAGSRQPDLEALRALGALMVFACHLPWYQYFPGGLWPEAPEWLSPNAPLFGIGGFAVVLFLVLSGTGLCRLLVLKAPPLGRYLRDRLGKLFGIFWTIAIPVLVVWYALGWLPLKQLPNAALMLLGLGFVTESSWAAIFASWWYMAIAWQAVLIVPLMVWGFRRIRPAGVLVVTALVVLAGCFFVPALGYAYGEKALIVGRGLEVLGGAFLALEMWPEVREKLGVSRRGAALLVAATYACMVALLVAGLGGRWLYRSTGLALTALVVYAHPIQRWGSARLARAAAYAGGLSFAVYLLHEPLMGMIRRFTGAPTHITLGLLAVISTFVVGAMAIMVTEGMARFSRARARRRAAAGEAAPEGTDAAPKPASTTEGEK